MPKGKVDLSTEGLHYGILMDGELIAKFAYPTDRDLALEQMQDNTDYKFEGVDDDE